MTFAPVGPSPRRMDVKAPRVKEMVLENLQITIRDLSNSLKLSIGTEHSTDREELRCKSPIVHLIYTASEFCNSCRDRRDVSMFSGLR